jgi:hypothetical protein
MAKFVIKLANLNETIDDVTFKQLANLRNQISPDELGKAQLQLRLAIEKVKTAFQKLLIAFVTPETVKGFGIVVDNVSKYLGKLADYLKGDAFNVINGAFRKLINFFTGMGPKLGSAISVGINRGLAVALPGGTNEEDLANYDKLMKAYQNADADGKSSALKDFAKGVGVNTTISSNRGRKRRDLTDDEIKQRIEREIGQYGYNFNSAGGGLFDTPTGGGNQVQTPKDQIFANNSRIRITPMFGGDQYLKDKKPVAKTDNEHLEKISRTLDEIAAESKKTADATTSSAHSGKKAADSLVRTEYDYQNVSP